VRQLNLLRDVRLESRVSEAVDEAILKWPSVERAWETVEYILCHDPANWYPLDEAGKMRAFVFHGARSIPMPDIILIYSMTDELVWVYDAQFKESRFPFHGTA
jgi:hypothetical protein